MNTTSKMKATSKIKMTSKLSLFGWTNYNTTGMTQSKEEKKKLNTTFQNNGFWTHWNWHSWNIKPHDLFHNFRNERIIFKLSNFDEWRSLNNQENLRTLSVQQCCSPIIISSHSKYWSTFRKVLTAPRVIILCTIRQCH